MAQKQDSLKDTLCMKTVCHYADQQNARKNVSLEKFSGDDGNGAQSPIR